MAQAYGKRSLWQWVVIYLIIGVVVYGVIYYFVLAKKGSTPAYQAPTSAPSTQTAPSSAPTTPRLPGY